MKKSIIVIFVLLIASVISAQNYVPVDNGSAVTFIIKNFGSGVKGSFRGLQGSVRFDPKNLASAVFKVSADANSVNTGVSARDNHLRKEEYLDVAKHPRISFTSTKIKALEKPGRFVMEGEISIKGMSRPVSFPFTASEQGNGYLFTGSFTLNRKDFKVGGGGLVMADNLTVSLSLFCKKE